MNVCVAGRTLCCARNAALDHYFVLAEMTNHSALVMHWTRPAQKYITRAGNFCRAGRLNALDQQGDAHAAGYAERRQAILHLSVLHLVHQRRENACPCAADRVAESYRAAVDVQALRVEMQFAVAGQDLRRKRFVQLDETDVRKRE